MTNNDKLELIMEEVIKQKYCSLEDISEHYSLINELKNKIKREMNILNDAEEIDYLAARYLKDIDDEPITIGRISSLFHISFALANVIKERIIEIQDNEDFLEDDAIAVKYLKNQIYLLEQSGVLDQERMMLVDEEACEAISKGNARYFMLMHTFTKLLKRNKINFYQRSLITSSLLGYVLGLHNVDCYKIGINYRSSYKSLSSGVFMVSYKKQKAAIRLLEKELFKNEIVYKTYHISKINGKASVYPCIYLVPKKKIAKDRITLLQDYKDDTFPCIAYSDYQEHQIDFIKIAVFASADVSYIEEMNQIESARNIDLTDVSNLNWAVTKDIKRVFDSADPDFVLTVKQEVNNYTYDEYLNWLTTFYTNKDNALSETAIKALQVETLKKLIIKSYYFKKYPEESYRYYFKHFYNSNIRNHLLIPYNEITKEKIKEHLKNYHFDIVDRYIGIFFVINNKLVKLKELLTYQDSDYIDIDAGHYAFFLTLPESLDYEYSMFPRGRVLYNNIEQCFYVYADKAILKDKIMMECIKKEFNLPNINVKFKADEHYRTLDY